MRTSIHCFFLLFLFLSGAVRAETSKHHFLEMGSAVSLMNVTDSGVGFGPMVGYTFLPTENIPLTLGLTVTAARFDTAQNDSPAFNDFPFSSTSGANFTLATFVLQANYRFLSAGWFFASANLGYGMAMTIETRRETTFTPSFAGDTPVVTETSNRDLLQVGADAGFRVTDGVSLVLRPQMLIVKGRNFFTPAVFAQIAL